MTKGKAFALSVSESIYLLAPIGICLFTLAAFEYKTTANVHINWIGLPEWSFVSTFLFLTVLREKIKRVTSLISVTNPGNPAATPEISAVNNNDIKDAHIEVFFLGTLSIFSASFLSLLYASSTGLMVKPSQISVIEVTQIVLLCGALFFHTKLRYKEYCSD